MLQGGRLEGDFLYQEVTDPCTIGGDRNIIVA